MKAVEPYLTISDLRSDNRGRDVSFSMSGRELLVLNRYERWLRANGFSDAAHDTDIAPITDETLKRWARQGVLG